MKIAWQVYFSRPNKKNVFISSFLMLAITLLAFVYFLSYNENRIGHVFSDPVLNSFQPIALSEYTFFVTYFFAIYGLMLSFKEPALFMSLIQAYTLMTLIRMLCLYIVPLEAPATIIPLKDSFLQSCFYSGRENLKDLFFFGPYSNYFFVCFWF